VCPSTTPLGSDALVLLDRVDALIAAALDDKAAAEKKTRAAATLGKGLAGSGTVAVDRADLAEMRADINQIRTAVRTYIAK
jgi:hypothetical protein